MNRTLRSTTFWTLAVGIGIGAACMASIFSGAAITKANAQPPFQARTAANLSGEATASLHSVENSFAALAEYAEPAVVNIRSESKRGQSDVFGQNVPMGGEGSGFIFRPDGYIVTNDHVVGGFDKVTVVLNDGREFPGTVTRAQDNDIAIVKIDAKNLPSLPFGDSSKVKVGQFAMAIGSPFGLANSASFGHISALNRENAIADPHTRTPRVYTDLLQTDAAINMGNSGGPLINVDGQVVGINTSINSISGGSMGIGFAIPSNLARLIAEQLVENGKVVRSYMGLVPQNIKPYIQKQLNISGGAVIDLIPSDKPAAMAGLKKGDIIVRVGNYAIQNQEDVRIAMYHIAPGASAPVEVIRDGQHKTFTVKTIVPPPLPPAPQSSPMPKDFSSPDMPNPFGNQNPNQFGNQGGDQNVPPLRDGKAHLGVSVESTSGDNRKQFGVPSGVSGAIVTSIEPGSLAEKLGLTVGGVITELNGAKIDSSDALLKAMSGVTWGAKGHITFNQYGSRSRSTISKDFQFNG